VRLHGIAVATALLLAAPPDVAAQQSTAEEAERLVGLGQVWGFLKYFHPRVASGEVEWDAALLNEVVAARAAADADEYAAVLQSLLRRAGPVPPCPACRIPEPDTLRPNLNLGWLSAAYLPPQLGRELEKVRGSRHIGSGRYVYFRPGIGMPDFAADTAHMEPGLPDAAGRLLALFRYWNAVNYYFPYLYLNGGDWNDVLFEFVPRLLNAADAETYHLAILELTTRVRDTHVTTASPVLTRLLGPHRAPLDVRSLDGELVVWDSAAAGADSAVAGLRAGDLITHIDGEPVAERRQRLGRYVAAGNAATFERKLISLLLRSDQDSMMFTVRRAGRVLQRSLQLESVPPPFFPGMPRHVAVHPVAELVRVLPGNIGYVDLGGLEIAQVDSALDMIRGTRGVVLDVRNYPRGTLFHFAAFLNPAARPFVTFTLPDTTHPGMYREFAPPILAGPRTAGTDHYRGRVAILVDERTQSHAEFTVMALQTAPENRVVGSQTAGADGNVVDLWLPGGIRTSFTGVGVYYPDGRQTQRVGIVPDIQVRPTAAGVAAGRDEVLERALAWVRDELVTPSRGAAQAQPARPWTTLTQQDLEAIRDVLAANHPGPVDPENGMYGEWLRRGFVLASERAAAARSYGDYMRVLYYYTNGFRDGHIAMRFTLSPGTLLLSVNALLQERIDPFYWNADLPHERWQRLPDLFVLLPSDAGLRQRNCTFAVAGHAREITLRWFSEPRQVVMDQQERVRPASPQLGMHQVGDVWFISLPSFNYTGERVTEKQIERHAPELRNGIVVFDVRGNGGGNSAWGSAVAAALWSSEQVQHVASSLDWTVDWRVSRANIEHLSRIVLQNQGDGLTGAAESWGRARDAMVAAHERGEPLLRVPSPPRPATGAAPVRPGAGHVFLLTDGRCASACLDFADIVRRLPNTTHIGLPTSADAVYMDNTYAPLPSGLAGLSYSLKVYRNRGRGNNEWYEPHVRWPGGEMTDERMARWVADIARSASH
jgi:C-terminal processing protease CtpA/Prc